MRGVASSSRDCPLVCCDTQLGRLYIVSFHRRGGSFCSVRNGRCPHTRCSSLLPLLGCHRLTVRNRLPSSLRKRTVSIGVLQDGRIVFHFHPISMFSPRPTVKILLRTVPGQKGLALPNSCFQVSHRLAFISTRSGSMGQRGDRVFAGRLVGGKFDFPMGTC